MVNNYRGQVVSGRWKPRNCILGDEMGLGKTAQSIAVISWLKQYAGASAPCLVVAPLTTLGHWKREIETWTDLVRRLRMGRAVYDSLVSGAVGVGCACCRNTMPESMHSLGVVPATCRMWCCTPAVPWTGRSSVSASSGTPRPR